MTIEGRCYTTTRRYPRVVGNFQGLRLPVPLTIPQIATGLCVFVGLLMSRDLWAHLTVLGNTLVLLGLPLGLMRVARRPRLEGRTAWRAAMSAVGFWSARLTRRFSTTSTSWSARGRVAVEEFNEGDEL